MDDEHVKSSEPEFCAWAWSSAGPCGGRRSRRHRRRSAKRRREPPRVRPSSSRRLRRRSCPMSVSRAKRGGGWGSTWGFPRSSPGSIRPTERRSPNRRWSSCRGSRSTGRPPSSGLRSGCTTRCGSRIPTRKQRETSRAPRHLTPVEPDLRPRDVSGDDVPAAKRQDFVRISDLAVSRGEPPLSFEDALADSIYGHEDSFDAPKKPIFDDQGNLILDACGQSDQLFRQRVALVHFARVRTWNHLLQRPTRSL